MNNYSLYLPSYSIGERVYEKIPKICLPYGKSAVVIGGKRAMKAAKPYFDKALKDSELTITAYKWFGGECCDECIDKCVSDDEIKAADMIFAVGGGKATDTCKCIGERLNKPVFSFPTIASNCSCATAVSIMYTSEGVFIKPHFFEKPPLHAFINTEIIAKSPAEYMWAGMGDTYAKYYEATVSARGEDNEHYILLGLATSKMCVEPILKYGKVAMDSIKEGKTSPEFMQVVLAICVTTGIASICLTHEHTPHYNSGLAHAIFYALTSIEEVEKNHLHGEVVAFGMLFLLLCDGNRGEFEKIYAFNKSVGLPVKTADIGITDEDLRGLFKTITEMSDVEHYPYRVTEKMLSEALNELNKK